jgi:hypothetical protein
MKLIATIGANKLMHEHEYVFRDQTYTAQVSFMALAEAYGIEEIVLIGTKQSTQSIQELLDAHPNITMVEVDSDDVSEVFRVSLDHIGEDTVLDLTQGYRHYPMLTLLASVFLQNKPGKNIRQIYYAQTIDSECTPYNQNCQYRFVSLIRYLDIANMARIIHTFLETLIVPDYEVLNTYFIALRDDLRSLSHTLFSNDFDRAKAFAARIQPAIGKLRDSEELTYLDEHLALLQKELGTIEHLIRPKESKTLLSVSEYFLNKEILLHAVTLLHEAMLAFLDEKIDLKECKTYQNKKGKWLPADTFKKRSCLKRKLNNCKQFPQIPECKKFANALKKIDRLRNASAHAFTSSTGSMNLSDEIHRYLKLIKRVIAS